MKSEKIDILKFYSEVDHKRWNEFLFNCYKKSDVQKLLAMRNGFQQGMADLEKTKMNTEKIAVFFMRIQRSIENTIKQIHRDKNPSILYVPTVQSKDEKVNKELQEKRKLQNDLERFIRQHNY